MFIEQPSVYHEGVSDWIEHSRHHGATVSQTVLIALKSTRPIGGARYGKCCGRGDATASGHLDLDALTCVII